VRERTEREHAGAYPLRMKVATGTDAWLRWMVMLAIILLVLHAVGSWSYSILGIPAAIGSALLVAAVSFFSARMAGFGRGNSAWFVVPTLVFTMLPLAARLWTLTRVEQTWWTRIVEFTPFLIGFAAPVLLLLAAYVQLASRASKQDRA
jgi:asparagine N-glycosylation enzyme membrane subunit Stt3